MAQHCPICDSTDIEQRVTPKGVSYYHCNECGSNFRTPVVDPEIAAAEAPAATTDGGNTE